MPWWLQATFRMPEQVLRFCFRVDKKNQGMFIGRKLSSLAQNNVLFMLCIKILWLYTRWRPLLYSCQTYSLVMLQKKAILKGQKQDYLTNAPLFMKRFLMAAWFNSSCCVTSEVCVGLACSAYIGKRVWGWCVTSQQRFLSRLIISGRYKLRGLRSWTTNMWFTQSAKERVTESNTSSAGKERHVGDPGWHRVQARYD